MGNLAPWSEPARGAYGRSRQRKTVDADGQIRTRTELVPISAWRVCLPDHDPGYVSWTDYLAMA